MVLVDTSIWISLYRKKDKEIGHLLWSLTAKNEAAVCGQIWVEFIGGFRKKALRLEYENLLRSFPFLESTIEGYELAAEILATYPELGPGDATIAATAMIHKTPLFTLDNGFSALGEMGLDVLGLDS